MYKVDKLKAGVFSGTHVPVSFTPRPNKTGPAAPHMDPSSSPRASASLFLLSSRLTHFRYHILVIFVFRIFLCSWKMPYMSASLVGGHPGT